MESIKFPFFSKLKISKAKVEKVVKPPQKPTFKNNINLGSNLFFSA